MFITAHLDGKNRIICMDIVSVGCINLSIRHLLPSKESKGYTRGYINSDNKTKKHPQNKL